MTIKVAFADDHALIRAGVRYALSEETGIEVVGEASDGTQLLLIAQQHNVDVAILDINMPGPSTAETILRLRALRGAMYILILTAFDDLDHLRQMMACGVDGYLLKDDAMNTLTQAIRTVTKGGKWYSQTALTQIAAMRPEDRSYRMYLDKLTERELTILRLLTGGLSDAQISKQLALSDRMVRYCLGMIYDKLAVHTRVEAAVLATKLGLVHTSE